MAPRADEAATGTGPAWLPDLLSLLRVPLGALYARSLPYPPSGLAVLALAAATDVLDGWLARRWHVDSIAGSAVDSFADKLFALSVVGALVRAGRLSRLDAALLFVRELGELALIATVTAGDRRARWSLPPWEHAGRAGKLTTGLQFATVVAAQCGWSRTPWLVRATGLCGAVAAVGYWQRERRARRDASPA